MLLLQEAESPAHTTDRDDPDTPPRAQLRQLRLTQNQIRLSAQDASSRHHNAPLLCCVCGSSARPSLGLAES